MKFLVQVFHKLEHELDKQRDEQTHTHTRTHTRTHAHRGATERITTDMSVIISRLLVMYYQFHHCLYVHIKYVVQMFNYSYLWAYQALSSLHT